jgi:hypothetical protein
MSLERLVEKPQYFSHFIGSEDILIILEILGVFRLVSRLF